MVIPLGIAVRYRWLIRIALAGYAATTIVGWAIDPIFYSTAYLAKAIEVALITLLAIDFARRDGNPIERFDARSNPCWGDRTVPPPVGPRSFHSQRRSTS